MDFWRQGSSVALATLVRVEGSSYRRPGAKLLIGSGGESAGSISGGCLEAEVVRKALWSVRNGAVMERYSTLFDDTADMPYGLGCGGTVDVLLEPAGTPEFTALMEALSDSLQGKRRRLLTELPEEGTRLRRFVYDAPIQDSQMEDGPILDASLRDAGLHDAGLHESWVCDNRGACLFQSTAASVDGKRVHFEEWLQPPQRLLLLGAGRDAQPITRIAALLGWSVFLADGRSPYARPERFPEAERVVLAESLDHLSPLRIGSLDAVVLMSHSYEQDRRWLTEVLPMRPRYLGLLGSRHRSALLMSEAAAKLGWPLEQACEGVFAPVGLDLGGDGAEAIALAVVAEIQACTEGKLGHSRRMTPVLIEEQIAKGGASRYLQTQCAV